MKMFSGTAAVLIGAFLTVNAGKTHAQSTDPCTIMPASYALIENASPSPQMCTVYYWQRVSEKVFGGLREFGAYVIVDKTASVAAATEKFATAAAKLNRWSPADYGDGGMEVLEDPKADDHRLPSATETQTKVQRGRVNDLIPIATYGAYFRCGPNIISVYANPSRGADARGLIVEMVSKFRSGGACPASGGSTTTTAPPVVAPPPRTPPAPTTPPVVEETEPGGTRYFEGQAARDLMNARAAGSRYMAVLSRTYDNSQGCFVEERAWVSNIAASNTGRVGAVVGPVKTVCVKGPILDQAAINAAEANLERTRQQLAAALQKKAEFEVHLKDPNFAAWAKGEIAKIDAYITSYTNFISQTEAGLAASVPPVSR